MAQDLRKMIKKLEKLIVLDRDAVGAYEAAVERMSVPHLRERLRAFQQDHERHIRDLSNVITDLGGEAPQAADLKGAVLKGLTAITSSMGDQGALTAMRGNEELTNRTYQKALGDPWPENVRRVIERNRADEQRHLAFIQAALREHAWESETRASP
jgi:uncharacterized protein (TIGR02284 family)